MKRGLILLILVAVFITGCAQKVVESEDIGLEEVQEDMISQELGQEIVEIDTLGEDEFGLGTEFEDFESDLETFEW